MVAGVAILAAAAGVVVAGLPGGGDTFVLPSGAATTTEAPALTVGLASLPVIPTTVAAQVTTTEVASAAPVPSTTVPPTTTAVPTTVPPSTAAPTTVAPTTTAAVATTLARADVRLVLANGDGRFNLVGANASRLEGLGYVSIEQDDVSQRPTVTMIYARPGFEDEALVLRDDLGTPSAMIVPLTDTPVTNDDAAGDLIVVLGPDAPR